MSVLDRFHAAGITERQLGFWIRQGYLHPSREVGGRRREWPRREVEVALLMKRLTASGFTAAAAAEVARGAVEVREIFTLGTGDPVTVDLGAGLELTVSPAVREKAA